jgi:Protein of unknown function (DUF3011)
MHFKLSGNEVRTISRAIPSESANRNWRMSLSFLGAIFLFLMSAGRLHAQSGMTSKNGPQMTCASDDMRRHFCPVNTSRGVRLVNQRSQSPCVQGQTWGYDKRGVWVDRGCRADFFVPAEQGGGPGYGGPGYGPPPPGRPPYNAPIVNCSSNNGKRNYCNADTSRGVSLARQISGSACTFGQTWGYSRGQIWVDRGCRADFRLSGGPPR